MAINYQCILAYGLTQEELDKIQKRRLKVKEVTNENASMRIVDILCEESKENTYAELPVNEKALIFNGYNDKELRNAIKFIRTFIEGGVLAVVTEQSSKWTFKDLMEHLIEEREWYKAKGQLK
ncbi:DUF3783 domain-containing protein [Clostridium saccharobutylicum]|uniref:DUF3783 domain-containing protein n=1 Tax=Clostridium saccharobutylicum DSM 13864 TaxID=1345695 RepID=U5MKR4_CLOSA|nr:DUF3783 domain-containing protein [Clostridium saccharobutylicum]AGX41123.1 hypothetical protein CLSA_c00500 [Clostridium saccharobutylicum DSM 13864]AQR88408.1 hypothetical protein CLOSC_00490 [Clostridium saccharobutylicum]AQR98306.1 hypothetical protein CSACC_00490 [Clostridium saccharobutylicum]AQS08012.1 hypothetical protein CLOBY_00610 [Clostridium saccharobutylicum]AQS12296.1 hypothetical protein CLOSACC_00490 [Clostridium saccharobutylicum]